ncbi:unnamed protein product [Prunus brigantina]
MSSPNTRAKSSLSSRPPAYLTGDGVDQHAIEVHSRLHPYAQKNLDENVLHLFENTLVLGPHWFGSVPGEIAVLFKEDVEAPLCFQSSIALSSHTWVSKNLSRSFPSSEVRNSNSVNRNKNLMATALCFWNSSSNTFDFRLGPMSPTLLDLAQIFGFRPHRRPADAVGDYHRGKNRERLAKPFTIPVATINQNCSFSNFLKKFVFPNRSSAVLLEYKHLAKALHNHADVGFGPIVLAHLYKNLHSATLESPLNISAPGAFWMIQIWLQVYFPELRFPDIVLLED